MIHVHRLDGCAPTPLAHYLKAIGILRLVAEQADEGARGFWAGDRFRLLSTMDHTGLVAFFLTDYQPTPLLAPWNGASGFFRTWDSKNKKLRKSKNAEALSILVTQDPPRWQKFRDAHKTAICAIKNVAQRTDVSKLTEKERKDSLILPTGKDSTFLVANKTRDKAEIQRWMTEHASENAFYRSAIVALGDGNWTFPSLWGSGGNDGAMDFTARYFEALQIALLSDKDRSERWLENSLFNVKTAELLTGQQGKIGMFLPGGAGGANRIVGVGNQNDTLLNPWDLILLAEGASVFASHATKRFGSRASSVMAAPFAVHSRGAGYSSATSADESPDGEQWMPLWRHAMSPAELTRILAEGRAQIGSRPSLEPLDFARSLARLGTARGITSFQRYGYIERNGQSNLAVSLGRFSVPQHTNAKLACLDDLDAWLTRLRRESRAKDSPARLRRSERQLSDALLTLTQHPEEPRRWQRALVALAAIEAVMVSGSGFRAGPIPCLRPDWVSAADDGHPDLRLALALALQGGGFEGPHAQWWNSVRRHWLPLDRNRPDRFAQTVRAAQVRLQTGPEVVMTGRSGEGDAIALVHRRLVEAAQHAWRRLPLEVGFGASAHAGDLSALLSGAVDLDHTLALARALMALDSRKWSASPVRLRPPRDADVPDDGWLVLRLALLPPSRSGAEDVLHIRSDPVVFRRLASGDVTGAIELALRRLRSSGIRTAVRTATMSRQAARRWAAALAFPIDQRTTTRFVDRLDPARTEATTED